MEGTAGQIIVRRSAGLPFRPVYNEWFPNNPVQRAQGSYRREQDSPAWRAELELAATTGAWPAPPSGRPMMRVMAQDVVRMKVRSGTAPHREVLAALRCPTASLPTAGILDPPAWREWP